MTTYAWRPSDVEVLQAIIDTQDAELADLRRSRDVPWTFAWALGTAGLLVGLLLGWLA